MRRTRIKVCGMREVDQVKDLVDLGVDAIGMIFFDKSPRNVSVENAKLIRKIVPAFVDLVGVFVNSSVAEINATSKEIGLDLVQLHGDQSVDFASKLETPYVKVIRVESIDVLENKAAQHHKARACLLDTYSKDAYGGTGLQIDESLLPAILPENMILAGGLNLENITCALRHKPFAVDINSGVELSPANKDIQLVRSMIESVRKFDQEYC